MMQRIIYTLILIASTCLVGGSSTAWDVSAAPQAPSTLSYVESSNGLVPPNLDGGPIEVEMGDVNDDGNPDLLSIGDHGSPYVNTDEHGVMVWFGNGQGGWSVYQNGEFGYGGIALGDANNDGLVDVGYGMHHNYSGMDFGDQLLEVALGDGTGMSWTPWDDGLATNGESWGMFGTDFADLDHDGDLDLGSVSFGCCNGVHVYLNQMDGSWEQSWSTTIGGNSNEQITFGDVNGDGDMDLAATYSYGVIYLGDGDGSFSLEQGNLPAAADVSGVALGDTNHDGQDELGLVLNSGAVQVWRWQSPGVWENMSGSLPSNGPYEVVQLADMDMDGQLDVAAFGTGQGRVWLGDGAGGWLESASFSTPPYGYAQAFRVGGDADHNGYPDIVLVSEEGDGWNYQNHMHFYKEASTPDSLEIKPVAPAVHKTYYAGSVIFIDWISAVPGDDLGRVSLELSTHGADGPWQPINNDLPNNGRYQWLLPSGTPSSEQTFIRYTLSTSTETVQAVTPGPFNIIGAQQEPISGLEAHNDGPTILGETSVLSATIISGTNVLYGWDLGDGITTTGRLVSHAYPEIGIYTATVTASNDISSQTATTAVEVYEEPITGLMAINDSPTLLGETTHLTATVDSGSNVVYSWDLGDGSTAGDTMVSHIYAVAGIYTATVTASNKAGEVQASTSVVIIPPAPIHHYFWLPMIWR